MDIHENAIDQNRRDEFARQTIGALRQAGETRPVRYDPANFRLLITVASGAHLSLELEHAYHCYLTLPEAERPGLLEHHVRVLKAMREPTSFEVARPGLFPH